MTPITGQSPTPGCFPTETPDDVDIPAPKENYRAERDKRLRVDGSTQYLELTADLAELSDIDPCTTYVARDPLLIETDVLILGGGFAGLLTAVALKKRACRMSRSSTWAVTSAVSGTGTGSPVSSAIAIPIAT
jgi:hypothetical protein